SPGRDHNPVPGSEQAGVGDVGQVRGPPSCSGSGASGSCRSRAGGPGFSATGSQVPGSIGLTGPLPNASVPSLVRPATSCTPLGAVPVQPSGPAPRLDAETWGSSAGSGGTPMFMSMNSLP